MLGTVAETGGRGVLSEIYTGQREDCPMRHAVNKNCLILGGFCTANSDELCKAVRDAYDKGWRDAATRAIRILERHKEVE